MLAVLSVEHGPGAEACLGQAQLVRGVERRLKRRVFVSEAQADLRFRVRFVAKGDEIEARIELSNRDGTARGTRSLVTTGHCSKLDDSLALSVALLVDEPPEPEPAEPAAAPAGSAPDAQTSGKPVPPQSTTRVIEIPAEAGAPREPWHVAVGAAGKGAWGVLPGVRPAVQLSLRLSPATLPGILLQAEAFWPTNAERDQDSGARFRLQRVGLLLCPELVSGSRARLGVCIGQQLSWLSAEGYGFDRDLKQQRLGYSLVLGGEARLRLFSPVSLRGALGAELPLVRDRFSSAGQNAQELFRPAPLGISAEIGLEAQLW